MFPAGAAGCGLLILRLCAAGMLLSNVLAGSVAFASWEIAALAIVAAMLCLGVFTPLTCIGSGFGQIALFFGPDRNFVCFPFSIAITTVLFLVGPGGYSVDSYLFGRRLIRTNSR